MIQVLLVDDSAVIRSILKLIFKTDNRFEIVGEVTNGQAAIDFNKKLNPDLIIMDVNMPVMDGIEATKIIMQENPTNIVIFTTENSTKKIFEEINDGSIEFIPKPDLSKTDSKFYDDFREKMFLHGSKEVFRKKFIPSTKSSAIKNTVENTIEKNDLNKKKLILVGTSTGGPIAVQSFLKDIGKDVNVPILVTQHIDSSFASHYAEWLSETTGMNVHFASDGEICQKGVVYIAPANFHLLVEKNELNNFVLKLSDSEPIHFLKPAVDPMFFSAKKFAEDCIGILLTGMGRDGASGSVELKKNGCFMICESEETCSVFGMPKAAIEEGGADVVLPLYEIGNYVKKLLG